MFRIATFNLENLEEDLPPPPGEEPKGPSFAARAAVLRPALDRMRADVVCFQEVHGQERPNAQRDILALRALLVGTRMENFTLVSTMTTEGQVYDQRNLVVALRPGLTVDEVRQINGDVTPNPSYRRAIADDAEPKPVRWERPLQYVRIGLPGGGALHVFNAHFKSKIAVRASAQMVNSYTWKSAAAWAEGYFLSSMKRVGAAIEARQVIDGIFAQDPGAAIVIAGDFNADSHEVPVMALRGRVEETGNAALAHTVMTSLEDNVPESKRFTLYHHGKGEMIDHILASRRMVAAFMHTEIHNETVPDESIAFATDRKFPESDHAPVVACFDETLLGFPAV